jgi:phosphoribosylformylglycinamidine cyclo-ligase
VNHCINDILVQGAKPLFFMDYVATAKLNPQQIADVVKGIALACEQNNIALLGGETAEMPGVYHDGEIDIAGTIVGVVEHGKLIDGQRIEVGDVILNLPSSGLHTNGFSLARKILDPLDWESVHPKLGMSIGDALLKVHQPYLQEILHMQYDGADIRGLAHITGGGVVENLPRILPSDVSAQIQIGSWDILPIFNLIQELGNVDSLEMYRVFNMGLGMLIVVKPEDVTHILNTIDDVTRVGEIVAGDGSVALKGLA